MSAIDLGGLDETNHFLSFPSLRAAHNELLHAQRVEGESPKLIASIDSFLRRGQATGVLLDGDDDRKAAQSLLNYWATTLYRFDREPPDATLAEFDPMLAPELPDSACPYLGLDAFTESRSDMFFGREQLVSELLERLRHERLLAVLGSSGSGKSSVVRAGVIPALSQEPFPSSSGWTVLPPMVPGARPLQVLNRLLTQHQLNLDDLAPWPNVVLVVDQFEEAFTLCTDDVERRAFVGALLQVAETPNAEHRVILTMRTDFESYVSRLPEFLPRFEQAVARVTPLTASELREAIEAPARRIGLKFESGVVNALLNEILGEPAALPLLQFTLLKLWEGRERNRVTMHTYKRLGGGRQALARAADAFYDALIPEEQVTARRILLKLARPGEGTEVTSQRVLRTAVYAKADAADRVERVLGKLLEARLVRLTQGDIPAEDQVEVAHEALVRNWPRLVEWLDDERTSLRQRQRLTAAAEEWDRRGHDPNALWRGAQLTEASRYDDLSELETEFVSAGRAGEAAENANNEAVRQRELEAARKLAEELTRAAERQRRWVQRLAMVGLLALLLAIVALFFGYKSEANYVLANQHMATAEAASTDAIAQKAIAQTQSADAISQMATAQAAIIDASLQRATAQAAVFGTDPARATAQAIAARNFSGHWWHNFGTMDLTQTGNSVTGRYSNMFSGTSGTISGSVLGNTDTLVGTWSISTTHGTFTWTISSDGQTFDGKLDGAQKWCGARIDASVPPGCSLAFVHTATSTNVSYNWTVISHPLADGNPNAIVFAIPNYSPGGSEAIYNNHPTGVWYTRSNQWAIFNQDQAPMPAGAAFNVLVLTSGDNAFVHTATAANIRFSNQTVLNNPLTDGHPSALVFAMPNYNPGGTGGVYDNHVIGVYYNNAQWAIYNQDNAPMPAGAAFNVLVLTAGDNAFVHTAMSTTINSNWTVISNQLTDSNPNAIVFAIPNYNPGGGGGAYNNHPTGVRYTTDNQWAIFNQDQAPMPAGAAFNMLAILLPRFPS